MIDHDLNSPERRAARLTESRRHAEAVSGLSRDELVDRIVRIRTSGVVPHGPADHAWASMMSGLPELYAALSALAYPEATPRTTKSPTPSP